MRKFKNQEQIMLISLILVVLVIMFGATVAWYAAYSPVDILSAEFDVDDLGDLYVWVQVENHSGENNSGENNSGENSSDYIKLREVGVGDDVRFSIDMNIVAQDNIENHTLAPGAFGQVKFKIESKSATTTGYKINIMPMANVLNVPGNQLTDEEMMKLITSHIKFYAKCDKREDGTRVYSNPILYSGECKFDYENLSDSTISGSFLQDTLEENDYDYVYRDGLTGNIQKGEEKYITLYWYWPYEFSDIPECLHSFEPDSIFYSEYEKFAGKSLAWSIESYDWDDTYMGNFASDLKFHFDVETIR